MEHTLNLNQNKAECIKSISKFGETIYQNICNGQVTHVEWGSVDWLVAIVLSILGIGLAIGALIMCISLIFMILSDFY